LSVLNQLHEERRHELWRGSHLVAGHQTKAARPDGGPG
jgi:hypothetical protein